MDTNAGNWKKWNRRCLGLLLVAAALPPVLNLIIDPFDIFSTSLLGPGPYTNQRVQVASQLQAGHGHYNTLMLGTSVAGTTPAALIDSLVPGARTYNGSMFLATASDLLVTVKRLHADGSLPPNLLIGVDRYLFAARDSDLSYEFRLPAQISGESPLEWWAGALFAPSVWQATTKVLDVIQPVKSVQYDFGHGGYVLPRAEKLRRESPSLHAKQAFKQIVATSSDQLLQPELDALSELVDFLDTHNVHIQWFLQPVSAPVLEAAGPILLVQLQEIRRRLPSSTVDLSFFEPIVRDPAYWYDAKHYTPAAAALVMTQLASLGALGTSK